MPFPSCTAITWQEIGIFLPLPVFYTQSAVGRSHLVRCPRFIPQSAFYILFVSHTLYSAVHSPHSAVRSPCFIPTEARTQIRTLNTTHIYKYMSSTCYRLRPTNGWDSSNKSDVLLSTMGTKNCQLFKSHRAKSDEIKHLK